MQHQRLIPNSIQLDQVVTIGTPSCHTPTEHCLVSRILSTVRVALKLIQTTLLAMIHVSIILFQDSYLSTGRVALELTQTTQQLAMIHLTIILFQDSYLR